MTAILIENTRASFLYCFEPYIAKPSTANPNPKPVYTVHTLLPANPAHPQLLQIAKVIDEVGLAEWKDQWPAVKEAMKGQDKLCLHKGEISKAGRPEYVGMYFVSASNKQRFSVFDADRSVLTEKDGRPYSGAFINAKIDIWAQNNSWGKRINATVTGIQFLRHGDKFGGGPAPAQAEEFGVHAQSADAPPPGAEADPTGGLL